MEAEGGMANEITKRVGAGWRNCKKCCGVLCDRRMPVKLKGKVYKTVIKPEMLYGAETWATTKRQGKRIEVTELVLHREIKCSKRRIPEQVTAKNKWWRLKEENLNIQFREKVLSERRLLESVQE